MGVENASDDPMKAKKNLGPCTFNRALIYLNLLFVILALLHQN